MTTAIATLRDWRCEGQHQGRECRRVLLAFDPGVTTLLVMKAAQQVKCPRCGHANGISLAAGRREAQGR